MKFVHTACAVLVVVGLHDSFALGNSAPRRFDPAERTIRARLEVRTDPTRDVAVLRIGRTTLNEAGIEPNFNRGFGSWSPTKSRSIVAALAMSLGIGGTFFVRKRRAAAIAVATVAATILGAIGVEAWANMAPPPKPPEPPRPLLLAPRASFQIQQFVDGKFVDPSAPELSLNRRPSVVEKRLSIAAPAAADPAKRILLEGSPMTFGIAANLTSFADLVALKPGPTSIAMSGNPLLELRNASPMPNFGGEVVVVVTDEQSGVQLTLGTKRVVAPGAAIGTSALLVPVND